MYADSSMTVVQQLQTNWPRLRQLAIPGLDEWFSRDEPTPYPYDKGYSEAKDDPTMIFHTSGTTGKVPLVSILLDSCSRLILGNV